MNFNILGIGVPEIIIILVIAFLIVGPERVPEIGRKVGKFYRNMRRVTTNLTAEVKQAIDWDEEDVKNIKEVTDVLKEENTSLRQELDDLKKAVVSDMQEVNKSVADAGSEIKASLSQEGEELASSLNTEVEHISQEVNEQAGELHQDLASEADELSQALATQGKKAGSSGRG